MPSPDVNLSELIRNTTTESVSAKIRQIERDLANHRYMALAVVHAALALYDRQLQKQHSAPDESGNSAAATQGTTERNALSEHADVLTNPGPAADQPRGKARGESGLHRSSEEI